jgi:hypothetical protein
LTSVITPPAALPTAEVRPSNAPPVALLISLKPSLSLLSNSPPNFEPMFDACDDCDVFNCEKAFFCTAAAAEFNAFSSTRSPLN